MVMRAMRDSAKWVMLILSLAFVGWLVFDWVSSRGGAGVDQVNPIVARVDGQEIRNSQWRIHLQNRIEMAREQRGGTLSEEDTRLVTQNAWDELISTVVLQNEIERLGIEISDAEVQQAFRTRPPPEFQTHPAFQTDGQFDIEKYRQFFANPAVDEALLLQLESYYRSILPRERLANLVVEGIYVSDAELWQYYRDANESARVRFLAIDPDREIDADDVSVSEDAIRSYYREHRDEFERPARATVNMVSIPVQPTPSDTVAAEARADSLREAIRGGATFEDLAASESADSASAARGGELGRVARGDLNQVLDEVAFSAPLGTVSEPVRSQAGLHLVRVDSREADSATVRHILIPIELSPETEDSIFDLLDELEGIALQNDLVTAADSLGIPMRRDVELTEGSSFVPGAGALGVAPEWALDPGTVVGDLSRFWRNPAGYHVFELLERQEAGTYPLEEVREQIHDRLIAEAKKAAAREVAQEAVTRLRSGASFGEIAGERGWDLREDVELRRVAFVPGLGQGTEAIGAAFGLPVGAVSEPLDAGDGLAILQVIDRTEVTREEFETVKEELRRQMVLQRRQTYVQRWLAALRENADVVDYRDQLAAAAAAQT